MPPVCVAADGGRSGERVVMEERHVLWTPWEGPGLEHLHLTIRADAIVADSVIVGLRETGPFRVRYTITCDAGWRMRSLDLASLHGDQQAVHLRTDGQGRWMTAQGAALPDLDGCLEVDISATPFTNTLPIRRLNLLPGATADVPAAYIDVSDFTVHAVPQRYTRCPAPADSRYLYEGLLWHFSAEIAVDEHGLVTEYPGLFKRAWASA
jgi:hypothetical protein